MCPKEGNKDAKVIRGHDLWGADEDILFIRLREEEGAEWFCRCLWAPHELFFLVSSDGMY